MKKTKYIDKYLELREEIWSAFEKLVRKGAIFNFTVDFKCSQGIEAVGVRSDTEGNYWFQATELVADPKYNLHIGEDLIVGTSKITIIFGNKKQIKHTIEPDILDLYWLCNLLDSVDNYRKI